MNIFKLKPIQKLDFFSLERPKTPNSFLACPHDYYSIISDTETPTLKYPINDITHAWTEAITQLKRSYEVIDLRSHNQKTYVQRSKIMGYPDIITVQFEQINIESSGITLYSRSQYGYSDMGVNKNRVITLLEKLIELLA